jgi:hypothetical protein
VNKTKLPNIVPPSNEVPSTLVPSQGDDAQGTVFNTPNPSQVAGESHQL